MIFRRDIQVLRGISVLLVVLYHLDLGWIKSGFLGVDVFFVISGFLMFLLYDRNDKRKFFERRAKRLLPAYLVTILISLIAAAVITAPLEFKQVAEQSAFGIFFSSNIGFWLQNSYFSRSEFNLLLHLWSLGVEIQFYLIVPLLFWVFSRIRHSLFIILLMSLLGCFLLVELSASTAFFMMPARLWEFLMGYAVAAYMTNKGAPIEHRFTSVGLAGLIVMLFIPLMPVDGEAKNFIFGHPGLSALGVTLATASVLAFGLPVYLEKTRIFKLLERLGTYSYSIYLVHFPVIVLYLYEPFNGTILKTNSMVDTLILSVLIMGLSFLMYRFVESPTRKTNGMALKFVTASLVIAVCGVLGFQFQKVIYSDQEMRIFSAWEDRTSFRCGKLARFVRPYEISCELNKMPEPPDHRVLLVGNSHADAIKQTFVHVAQKSGTEVHFMAHNNALMAGGASPEAVIELALNKKIDFIVLHQSQLVIEPELIRKVVQLAEQQNIRVSMIMPIPTWDQHILEALFANVRLGEELPTQSLAEYHDSVRNVREPIASIESGGFDLYEVGEVFCQPDCKITNKEGSPLYFDSHHLTITGSNYLEATFSRVIENAIQYKKAIGIAGQIQADGIQESTG
jgi:peptidoglycan/LPS O-acetylase OafA/YrhL